MLGTLAATRARTRSSWSAATATCCNWCATSPSRSGCSTSAADWPRRRNGARRGGRKLRRARRPCRTRVRRAGAAARRPVRRAARCAGRRREDRGRRCWRSTAHWRRSWPPPHDPKSKMSKAYRTKLLAATDYIEAAGPVVRVATDAPRHAVDGVGRAAAGRRAPAQGRQIGRAVRRDVVDRPAAEGARRPAGGERYLGRPTS